MRRPAAGFIPATGQAGAPPPTRPPRPKLFKGGCDHRVMPAQHREKPTKVTTRRLHRAHVLGPVDPGRETRDPRRPSSFTRHGLWVCVAHFKSKEPESKRPRICLEEGRAATWVQGGRFLVDGRPGFPGAGGRLQILHGAVQRCTVWAVLC